MNDNLKMLWELYCDMEEANTYDEDLFDQVIVDKFKEEYYDAWCEYTDSYFND